VARNNIDLSSGKVPLVTKSIQYKTMLISIPLICPFYCIGWVQNLETNIGLALVAGIGVVGCLQRKAFSLIEKSINQRNTRPLLQTKG
jgi:hypothetical protein